MADATFGARARNTRASSGIALGCMTGRPRCSRPMRLTSSSTKKATLGKSWGASQVAEIEAEYERLRELPKWRDIQLLHPEDV